MDGIMAEHTIAASSDVYPFNGAEGNMFPPVCLKTHWDPTAMLRHILPTEQISLPMDFRPMTKICKEYVTSGPAETAPLPPKSMVFPSGGGFYPPGRYSSAIDTESQLKALDHPADKWCTSRNYRIPTTSNLYDAHATVPDRRADSNSDAISELSFPRVLIKPAGYGCRMENDMMYWKRSGRMFNNATKQDRYADIGAPITSGGGGGQSTRTSVRGIGTTGFQAPS